MNYNVDQEEVEMINGLSGIDVMGAVNYAVQTKPGASVSQQVATATAAAIKASRRELLTRDQRLLESMVSEYPTDLKRLVQNGQVRFDDADFFVRKQLNAPGSIMPLLDDNNQPANGVSNIKDNTLSNPMLVSQIMLQYGAHATITDPSQILFTNTAATPTLLLNGVLEIVRAGKPAIEIPVQACFNVGGNYAAVGRWYNCLKLNAPFLINKDEIIRLNLRTPAGTDTYGTGNHFLDAHLIGTSVKPK